MNRFLTKRFKFLVVSLKCYFSKAKTKIKFDSYYILIEKMVYKYIK